MAKVKINGRMASGMTGRWKTSSTLRREFGGTFGRYLAYVEAGGDGPRRDPRRR